MWDVSTTIIVPIVVTANGIRRLSLSGWIKGMIQKAVLQDTARIVRRFFTLLRKESPNNTRRVPRPPLAWTLFPISVGYYILYF